MRGQSTGLSIALFTSFIVLAGCGQKGPLYLPQDSSNNASMAGLPPQAAAAEEKKDEASGQSSKQ